ncbi:MAG: hypothetical protein KGI41_01515 [Patescibacteria group bacterium]|nr:hypothetical protein [Patescibacteria group bacterium]MDE1965904.1 hypothetical protein [Patescibacteria group bacterium]
MENLPSAFHEDELDLPHGETELPPVSPIPEPAVPEPAVPLPSRAQQSYGALISVILILLMIVVGAFYVWGKRIAEREQYTGQLQHTLAQ